MACLCDLAVITKNLKPYKINTYLSRVHPLSIWVKKGKRIMMHLFTSLVVLIAAAVVPGRAINLVSTLNHCNGTLNILYLMPLTHLLLLRSGIAVGKLWSKFEETTLRTGTINSFLPPTRLPRIRRRTWAEMAAISLGCAMGCGWYRRRRTGKVWGFY